jgi:ABC-2 type transport system ATP-binding protein
LDEPAAALDPVGRRDVLEIMRRLRGGTTVFFSTHILDDVERVSDTVAVLDHGRRVAQEPIEVLLAGTGEVMFVVEVRGDGQAAAARLSGQPWVDEVTATPEDGHVRLQVAVSDPEAAEQQLLRVLLDDPGLRVISFRAHRLDLEAVFMQLVQQVPA